MVVKIVPEPTESAREAILAALETATEARTTAWAETALAEGVEESEPEP
jgi:hypothetical protein